MRAYKRRVKYTQEYINKSDLKEINKIVMNQNWSRPFLLRMCFDRALELGYKGTFPVTKWDNDEV